MTAFVEHFDSHRREFGLGFFLASNPAWSLPMAIFVGFIF